MRQAILIFVVLLLFPMCGIADAKQPVPQPVTTPTVFNSAKSYVYFYRPCVRKDTHRNVVIFDGNRKIGRVNCKHYIIYEAEPGEHDFNADDFIRHVHHLKLTLEAGKKYFVESEIRMSVMDSIPPLTLKEKVGEKDMTEFQQVACIDNNEGK